jgi:uncharacterized LabA/DUF88 family protein
MIQERRSEMKERVIVFIDGSNFYFGCRQNNVRGPWDMVSLSRDIVGPERTLIRTYYYNARNRPGDAPPEVLQKENKLYELLRRTDYCTVRLGRLEGKGVNTHQKGVDVLLVQDLLTLTFFNAMDTAVLISNDGDFANVLQEIKARGRQVEVAFPGPPTFYLREVCDKYIDLLAAFPDHFKKME